MKEKTEVKTIRLSESLIAEIEEKAHSRGLNFTAFMKLALLEYLYRIDKENEGNIFIEVPNAMFTPKLEKDSESKILYILAKTSQELKEIDPVGAGEVLNQLYKFYMQRLDIDDKETVKRYFEQKMKNDKKSL